MEKRTTKSGNSYWNESGAYQPEYDKLYEELVPNRGEADTIHGEMIRAVTRLTYDYYNNGNCNVIEVGNHSCDECGGSGWEEEDCFNCNGSGEVDFGDGEETCDECGGSGIENVDCHYCDGGGEVDFGDITINEYYDIMFDFLYENLNNTSVLDELKDFLMDESKGYGRYRFSVDEEVVYNKLVDEVMHQVLNTENEKRLVIDLC